MSPAQCWAGKTAKVQILGRRHLNGKHFLETYPITITGIQGSLSFADLIRECLTEIGENTEIPADLIEGFSIQFLPPST